MIAILTLPKCLPPADDTTKPTPVTKTSNAIASIHSNEPGHSVLTRLLTLRRVFYNNIAATNPFSHDTFVPSRAFESDEIRATLFPTSPKPSAKEPTPVGLGLSDKNEPEMTESPYEEEWQVFKNVIPLLQPTNEGWTSGYDSIITPTRTEFPQERDAPSASGRLGYQGLPNSTSAPTVSSKNRSPSPKRSDTIGHPGVLKSAGSPKSPTRQPSKVSFDVSPPSGGRASNQAKYDNPRIGRSNYPKTSPHAHEHEDVLSPLGRGFSPSSRITATTWSSSDQSKSSGRDSENSKTEYGNAANAKDLQSVRLPPNPSSDVMAEPIKKRNIRVNSKAEQILGTETYTPEPTAREKFYSRDSAWDQSNGRSTNDVLEHDIDSPASALEFPAVGLTMEALNNLLDDSIHKQNLARASSMYERTSLADTDDHCRSRSVSPYRSIATPTHSPSHSPTPRTPQELAEALKSKPLPDTPEKRRKTPSKQMIGDHGWLHREGTVIRTKTQKNKPSGFKNFANKMKQRAEEKVSNASTLL